MLVFFIFLHHTDKFYFLTFQNDKLKSSSEVHYFCTDDQFTYKNFNLDFGPLNLAMICRYCILVRKKIESFQATGRKLCHVTSQDSKKRTNAAFLVGCYSVLVAEKSPEETVRCLISQPKVPIYLPYRDVSLGPSLYNLGLLDCFRALVKSRTLGIFNLTSFNVAEYEHLEKMANGDINWIIPEKFLALPGPQNKLLANKAGFMSHTPEFYIPYFKQNNVTSVVRLNKDMYPSKKFTDAGIKHYDMYFPDGTVPPIALVKKFMDVCHKTPGAIAVHCKAGLGRTGTMIGCYMMKYMKFTAAESIAWLRMARPGSVIGMQQVFLNESVSHSAMTITILTNKNLKKLK
ncbi:hypothetical protein HELRODRAFT_91786 [Helobdella robusta]|uniref:protein-tyrosine-phosphatase n=1 Tax=Helobdella robusta TaxID=6412 RepID=T1G889_HELRO|nr:hypothetical protein HELRODRAFT_91786 [Helobdella robusta]ESO10472.1 hypothetical protein HELRODRAFT_91786 [Helobdella robusta]